MVKKLLDLINPGLNKCSLSLCDETDQTIRARISVDISVDMDFHISLWLNLNFYHGTSTGQTL